jgi:hypothetical protein
MDQVAPAAQGEAPAEAPDSQLPLILSTVDELYAFASSAAAAGGFSIADCLLMLEQLNLRIGWQLVAAVTGIDDSTRAQLLEQSLSTMLGRVLQRYRNAQADAALAAAPPAGSA